MILELQDRIAQLLQSEWAGVTILTDRRPDLVNAIAQEIGKKGLLVVITAAEGTVSAPERAPAPLLTETLRILIYQHRLATQRNAIEMAEEAMRKLHFQPVQAQGLGPMRLTVAGHRVDYLEDGLRAVEVTVRANIHLQP